MALIKTGWTYKFKFINAFKSHDKAYTIVKIYSWDELLKENISLYDLLYGPLNIPREQFNQDVLEFRKQNIYKLINPLDQTNEIFVPEGILSTIPLYPVKQYGNLVFYIPLGVYEDQQGLDYLFNQVKEQLTGALGVTHDPKLVATSYTYLTETEYQEYAAERNAMTKKILNFFTENIKLRSENDTLRAQIKGYQDLIMKFNGGE